MLCLAVKSSRYFGDGPEIGDRATVGSESCTSAGSCLSRLSIEAMESIETMNRKELQALAKTHGVKANLSNADIIAKLREMFPAQAPEQNASAPVDEPEVVAVITPETEVECRVNDVLDTAQTHTDATIDEEAVKLVEEQKEPAVGDEVQANIDGSWMNATIKRINKKSVRVCLEDGKTEHTVKFEDIRQRPGSSDEESTAAMEMEPTVYILAESLETNTMECVEPAADMPEVRESTPEEPSVSADTMDCAEQGTDSTASMETVEDAQKALVAAPAVEAPPTPISTAANVDGWNSSTKFSLPGGEWRDSMETAVVRKGKGRGKGKERRNAGRSTMERLVEDMKHEQQVEDMEVEASEETAPAAPSTEEAAAAVEEAAVLACPEEVPAVTEKAPTPEKVEPTASDIHLEPAPEVAVAEESVTAAAEESVAPMSVEDLVVETTVASTQAAEEVPPSVVALPTATAPAPVQAPISVAVPVPGAKTDGPRMNKAQAMRLDAIQKKLVVADAAPPAPTAFTIAAKPASAAPTPAGGLPSRPIGHTPSHRSSICTSAPSSALHGNGIRAKPLATPLGSAGPSPAIRPGRLSIQVSGTKRKVSESVERDRSSSVYTAPDFKRMHNKQFSTLKSIAECVDQDKTVSSRMTTAMESALAPQRSTPAVAPFKPILAPTAEVAKPAANPFSKVINKPTTPGKSRQVTATPILQSSSSSSSVAHGRAVTSASGTNGAGSANIVKSRTVTSFLPSGSAAPAIASCGAKPAASFLNNENAGPSSANCRGGAVVASFLKSKGSGSSASMFKHRSVSITQGGKPVNHGATKQHLMF